ncbi:29200_t:CDS:2, partial [Racocetra persica]
DQRLSNEIVNLDAKRHRTVTVLELELALKEFILIYQHRTILSNTMMIEKAKLLADELGIKLHGEADSVDEDVITESLLLLQSKYSEYPLDRIYNMDETRLFYQLEPDRTLVTRQIAGCKKNKDRISVALCTNADGFYKLAPLIIGKYTKPRCFKNKHRGQHVFLLLDNCSSHKLDELTLRYVDIHFLPKNTTSRIQPMDAGIIMAFKRAYHRFHLQWMLEQIEAGNFVQDLKMDVLQVILYIIKSWDDLCEASNSRLENLIRSLNTLCLPNAMETDEFLNFNGEEIVYEVFLKNQIIKKLVYIFRNDESVEVMDEGNTEIMDEEKDDSVEPAVVSDSLALNSLDIFTSAERLR